MSKIRNSLGVLVLPVPAGRMTFDEYKNAYGISVEEIFPFVIEAGSVMFVSNRASTKMIYISDHGTGSLSTELQPVLALSGGTILNGDNENIGSSLKLPLVYYDDSNQSLVVFAEVVINVFVDPDTPNTILYNEL